MTKKKYNEQEEFWVGDFGSNYIERNNISLLPNYIRIWSKMIEKTPIVPKSFLEFGCNIGNNLHALSTLFPDAELSGVEINSSAVKQVRETLPKATIYEESILNFAYNDKAVQYDLTFSSGVLIHIAPENLSQVYESLYNYSSRLILINEYYNPTPIEVPYRGHKGKLFKRDFCGELLDRFSNLRILDYGFFYHRSVVGYADDSTWFLLEKQ